MTDTDEILENLTTLLQLFPENLFVEEMNRKSPSDEVRALHGVLVHAILSDDMGSLSNTLGTLTNYFDGNWLSHWNDHDKLDELGSTLMYRFIEQSQDDVDRTSSIWEARQRNDGVQRCLRVLRVLPSDKDRMLVIMSFVKTISEKTKVLDLLESREITNDEMNDESFMSEIHEIPRHKSIDDCAEARKRINQAYNERGLDFPI